MYECMTHLVAVTIIGSVPVNGFKSYLSTKTPTGIQCQMTRKDISDFPFLQNEARHY